MKKNWKTYKLGEIAELRKEQVAPNGNEQPYIGLEHIEQQHLRLNGIGSSDDVISNKFKFYEGDILYGKLRPYFRKVYHPKFEGVCSTDIYVIKNKEKVDKSFLYYLIASEDFTTIANSGTSGTRMPRADWNQLEKSEWTAPDQIKAQSQIASVLSSLDNKIELNLQMNQTLEAMAQAIFKERFEEKKDWKTVRLGDLIDVKGGFSYEGKFIGSGNAFLLGMGCVSFRDRFLFSGARPYSGESGDNHLVKPEDIVIATRQQSDNLPILGFPAKIPNSFQNKKVIVGTNLYKVINKSNLNNSLLFQLLRSDKYKNHILTNSKGTTVKMITKDSIELFEFKIPPKELIQDCENVLKSIDVKLEKNIEQNQILVQLRDSLLPKLMTGKIQVKA